MTSRERVRCAFRHEETDRVPFNMRFAPELARKVGASVGHSDLEAYFDYDIRFMSYTTGQETPDFSRYLSDLPKGASVSPWGAASVAGRFYHFTRPFHPMRDLTIEGLEGWLPVAVFRAGYRRDAEAGPGGPRGRVCRRLELRKRVLRAGVRAAGAGAVFDGFGRRSEVRRGAPGPHCGD